MPSAIILSAGRGDRLRPITDDIPKPLCKIKNIPIIEYHIINLANAGIKRIIINHAYLGGLIREQIGNGQKYGVEVLYSREPTGGLETGGGIVNALPYLGKNPFIAVNADIYTDYPFSNLPLSELNSSRLAHLVLTAYYHEGLNRDFDLQDNYVLNNPKNHTFTGIACYHPELFNKLKPTRYSITPILRRLCDKKQISGELYHGLWNDIGSIERLEILNQ